MRRVSIAIENVLYITLLQVNISLKLALVAFLV
jgi:hypothetical protein